VFLLFGAVAGIWVYTAVARYLNDPQRVREDIERRLSRGENVTLIGETGPPGYFVWDAGEERTLISSRPDRSFSVGSNRLALIGFPYAARLQRYRLRAQVRHDSSPGLGGAGLYCSHQIFTSDENLIQSSFVSLEYADRGQRLFPSPKKNVFVGKVLLNAYYLEDDRHNKVFHPVSKLAASEPFTPSLDAPWRELQLDVTEASIRASWVRDDGKREVIAEVGPAQLRAAVRVHASLQLPRLKNLRMDFVPYGSFGLFVDQSTASFRCFVLESLD
jgi:hypothetical protein